MKSSFFEIRPPSSKLNLAKNFLKYMSQSPFLTLIDDETQFRRLRQRLWGQPTPRQSQAANSAAAPDIANDQIDDHRTHTLASTTNVGNPTANKQEKLFIHYTHERRFQAAKRDLHRVYEETV